MIGIIINSVLISSIINIGFFGWLRNLFSKRITTSGMNN